MELETLKKGSKLICMECLTPLMEAKEDIYVGQLVRPRVDLLHGFVWEEGASFGYCPCCAYGIPWQYVTAQNNWAPPIN